MNNKKETIYALSTPPGKSAIAVVRISGTNSYKYIQEMSQSMPTRPNKATINTLKTKKGLIIDKTITTYFKSPKSYTGEDMVEISLHGGSACLNKLIETLSKKKLIRMAEPGEFTRRSFENNKMDLIKAEAIDDLINAETESQRLQAQLQLRGGFSNKTKKIYNDLKNILANTEAIIDFSEEELPNKLESKVKEQIKNICTRIDKIIESNKIGRKIKDGFIVTIIGKPNTGKSSFINYISNQDIAIVTNIPGTTRDIIESYIDINGIPVRLYDTAGIRKAKNTIELIGINKSKNIAKNADINIIFIENTSDIKFFNDIKNPILVQSKSDIRKKLIKNNKVIKISSKNGKGIKRLLGTIEKKISGKITPENTYISRERQKVCLKNALNSLNKCKNSDNFDVFCENIRIALKEISKIYGEVDIEQILDIIFKKFCIGK